MESKTEQAIKFFKEGNLKVALRYFSKFKLGISVEDQKTLKSAYEILIGNGDFYRSIGYDLELTKEEAKGIINKIWIR